MQAALQPHVDSGISKTIPLPRDFPLEAVPRILRSAYDLGLKGCTLFRQGAREAVVTGRCDAAADPRLTAGSGRGTGADP
jgi:ribonucleoside-diphosphate reductase alpha chain